MNASGNCTMLLQVGSALGCGPPGHSWSRVPDHMDSQARWLLAAKATNCWALAMVKISSLVSFTPIIGVTAKPASCRPNPAWTPQPGWAPAGRISKAPKVPPKASSQLPRRRLTARLGRRDQESDNKPRLLDQEEPADEAVRVQVVQQARPGEQHSSGRSRDVHQDPDQAAGSGRK